jgi:CheY-like chemotaxis protein/HPt (histidine-containing phosphotransfer) domain-containing protein
VKLCEAILTTYGLRVTAAANGREAVDKIQHDDFDLVLMDLQMPEMDGIEAVRQIRAMFDEVKRALPVISLSANVFGSTAGKYADAGFTDELIKPFREEELIRVIEKYLNGSPRTRSSPKEEQPESGPYSLKYLESTSGSDTRFIRGMLESFVTKSEEQLSKMQDAMRQGDMKALQELAHKMIPSCRYLGMSAVEEKMRTLESLTAAGTESSAVASLLKEVNDELLAVIPMLRSEIDKHSQ